MENIQDKIKLIKMNNCQCLYEIENNLPRTKFCIVPCSAQREMRKVTLISSKLLKPVVRKLTKEDVWGKFDEETLKRLSDGMIVARGEQVCPVWKDKLPYKSVTVICKKEEVDEVSYWLGYVHGGNSISKQRKIAGGKVALRSNYMCW